jgi:hypothetical protein
VVLGGLGAFGASADKIPYVWYGMHNGMHKGIKAQF